MSYNLFNYLGFHSMKKMSFVLCIFAPNIVVCLTHWAAQIDNAKFVFSIPFLQCLLKHFIELNQL